VKHLAVVVATLSLVLPSLSSAQAPTDGAGGWAQPPAVAPPPPPPGGMAPPVAPGYFGIEPRRGSWYIGFGIGSGAASVTDSTGTYDFGEYVGGGATTMSLNFRVGATVTPKLLLGLDVMGIRAASSSSGVSLGLQSNVYDVAATFFPMEKGFYVKGGVGLSALVADGGGASSTWKGYDVMAGLGYCWWLGRTFNLSANLEANKSWYGSNGPDSTQAVNLFLGFDWF
jgi:hypothetical protein